MNTTTITVDGKEVTLRFGIWVLARLVDRGYKMAGFENAMKDNPFDFIPTLIYLGACNANGMNLSAYDESIFWNYIDSIGFNNPEINKVMTCFSNSITQDVSGQKKRPQTVKNK